jgi:hypothetical protein
MIQRGFQILGSPKADGVVTQGVGGVLHRVRGVHMLDGGVKDLYLTSVGVSSYAG